jgi:conjugal transfer pilus assembly protein TraU
MTLKSLALATGIALGLTLSGGATADGPACGGHFVNPITDICWECLFPVSIGSAAVSTGKLADTENPASPIQLCPVPPPVFKRVGLAIGFWEPMAITDVTRSPFCMVNLGGVQLKIGQVGLGVGTQESKDLPSVFYHVHWYKYPLVSWLNIFTDMGCMQGGDMDIGYLTELDPLWNDDALALIINPEAALFGNVVAQGACAADATASMVKPLDPLFWCAGAHGSLYPFTGTVTNQYSPASASVLLSERMAYKLHRQGMIMESVGHDVAVCYEYPSPVIPKSRWRYQMVNMLPDALSCHPFGQSTLTWETGHLPPNDRENYGYLMWRKRNCVYL